MTKLHDDVEVGNVCLDPDGDIGVVTNVAWACGVGKSCQLPKYQGRSLDGLTYWESYMPIKLAENADDYRRDNP